MTIQELLNYTNIPSQYGTMDEMTDPPFIVYFGASPDIFYADNIPYVKYKSYQLQYYFKKKDEDLENQLEDILTSDGWVFYKSDDSYIESEQIFVIYYEIERIHNYV